MKKNFHNLALLQQKQHRQPETRINKENSTNSKQTPKFKELRMLVKYEKCVINLDRVTEFVTKGRTEIKFFFDCYDEGEHQIAQSVIEFKSEEERNIAFEQILFEYGSVIRLE
jgi:hypothetical protein